ncbi:MAG: NUDIX domain-containing protein [Verrucomicrobia bacterium]|nr:NUDIX domain-containing protein [Verrucomicrobiota bacterium]
MQYAFCHHCGSGLPSGAQPYAPQSCAACGATLYHNSKPCAGALVVKDHRVLLVRRGIEPFKDYWDIPGGFLEATEHPEDAARREVLEETGLEVRLTGLLGIYRDDYGDTGHVTLNIYYLAEPVGGTERAGSDATELRWFHYDELPDKTAFTHEAQVLADWREREMRRK